MADVMKAYKGKKARGGNGFTESIRKYFAQRPLPDYPPYDEEFDDGVIDNVFFVNPSYIWKNLGHQYGQ
jgi:hypothetical protein